jgi:hypothetical protein
LRVFLSYHTPDRPLAFALKAAIENALPGSNVFLDQTHLKFGHFWQPGLFQAIAECKVFLILVSNHLGDWQKVEYYEAQNRKVRDDSFILLPIIIADRTKGPAANLPGLSQLQWVENTEPTAPEPLGKILAVLLGTEVPKPIEPWLTINPYRGLLALEAITKSFAGQRSATLILSR